MRDKPKGTNTNLRFLVNICGFLQESVLPKCFIFSDKARICKISENLRLGSVSPQ